jgi:predicted cupin superfamily sugar epimerase
MHKDEIISTLQLIPHPEGGYYRETYRSAEVISTSRGNRVAGTTIYFLLESGNFSAFHRLTSDEAWYYHIGDSVKLYLISPDGTLSTCLVGKSFTKGESLQVIMPAGHWFAAEVIESNGFTLVSCSVSPGFEFSDFEMANRESLCAQYPQHQELISRLCRSV